MNNRNGIIHPHTEKAWNALMQRGPTDRREPNIEQRMKILINGMISNHQDHPLQQNQKKKRISWETETEVDLPFAPEIHQVPETQGTPAHGNPLILELIQTMGPYPYSGAVPANYQPAWYRAVGDLEVSEPLPDFEEHRERSRAARLAARAIAGGMQPANAGEIVIAEDNTGALGVARMPRPEETREEEIVLISSNSDGNEGLPEEDKKPAAIVRKRKAGIDLPSRVDWGGERGANGSDSSGESSSA